MVQQKKQLNVFKMIGILFGSSSLLQCPVTALQSITSTFLYIFYYFTPAHNPFNSEL